MTSNETRTASELPQETVDFAHRMFDAARDGNAELLLAAVDAGLPPNLANQKGNTLLMLAAYAGHAAWLNDRGQAPIAGAVFKREDEVVRVLMEVGADPRAGEPNAIASARMFGRADLLAAIGEQEGDGAGAVSQP
ncbi:ankyrin [Lactarius hengduanensis]|nr:ankyrin [Lactarius hengduanensis]